ncbi:hypothetical protein ES703_80034 [subsurface metagenome]
MFFQEISQLAHVSGITAFISILVAFLFAGIILGKAIKEKSRILFEFALCIIFTISPWFPSGMGYLYFLTTGVHLPYEIYIIIGNLFLPLAIIFWLDIYLTTVSPSRRNLILCIYIIFSIIFWIYAFYFLYFSPNAPVEEMLGIIDDPTNPFDIDFKWFVLVYLATSIFTSCGTGFHFAAKSLKIEDKEIQWKGRFLLIAFLCFGISAIADSVIPMTEISLVIFRIVLILANLFFYIGFILPKWIKKIIFREDKTQTDRI